MKLLLCTHAFAPQVGGQETVVMALARGLSQHSSSSRSESIELTVATSAPADGMNDAALAFRIVRRPSFLTLLGLLHRADVIHLAGPLFLPMILGLILRKPVVVEHHGFQAICPNGQLFFEPTQEPCPGHFMAGQYRECIRCNSDRGIFRAAKMWALTFPRRWLCQRVSVNILPTNWLGTLLRLNRMTTIVHGLPPAVTITKASSAPQIPSFAFLGRLVSTKGTRVLLEAARQLKAKGATFHVKIIGQGPDREALEMMARNFELEDCVEFLGYIPVKELDGALANVTAIIMPSIAGEVFGLAAAENMQRGRLMIVSNIGALAEVVGDAAMKFAPGDAVGLATCMETAITNPELVEELKLLASKRIAQSFRVDQMIRDHLRTYTEL